MAGLPHRGSHLRFAAVPMDLATDIDLSAFAGEGVRYASRFFHPGGRQCLDRPDDLDDRVPRRRRVGNGIGDVWVADPATSTDTFDGAAALEVETPAAPGDDDGRRTRAAATSTTTSPSSASTSSATPAA